MGSLINQLFSGTSTRWNNLTKKASMPAPFLALTTFALVFGLMSLLQKPCSVCGGTGLISSSAGLDAQVVSSTIVDSYIPLTCCDHPQVQYLYDVSLSVENASPNPLSGAVTLSFFDIEPPLSGVDEIPAAAVYVVPIQVDVPGGTTIVVNQQISFIDIANILNQPHVVKVESGGITTTSSACPVCNGKGRLPFYAWLEARIK